MIAPKFGPGDRFIRISNNKMGTVNRVRDDTWERTNAWIYGHIHYSVTFDDGSFETYLDENEMIAIGGTSRSQTQTNCKFMRGDRVSVSNQTIMFSTPLIEQYVNFKRGVIDMVLPRSQFTIPPNICLYNIKFDDGTMGVEVHEYKINLDVAITYDNTLSVNDLVLLNNFNQNIIKQGNRNLPTVKNFIYDSEYQDLNEDKKLQNDVIEYYLNKTIKWLEKNEEFNKVKKHLKFVQSKNGYKYIKSILKLYIKKYNAKWFELRDENNYSSVKEYIRKSLTTI
jgi:signal peptidase I